MGFGCLLLTPRHEPLQIWIICNFARHNHFYPQELFTKKLNEFSKFWVSFQISSEYYSQTPWIISGIWPEFWNFAALTWADSGVKKQTSSKAFIKTEILIPVLSVTPPTPPLPAFGTREDKKHRLQKPVGCLDSCHDRTMNKKPEKIELCKTERLDKNSDLITNFSF